MEREHEIVLYQIEDTNICVTVIFKNETFWLTQRAMAELFDVKIPAISKHLAHIFEEGELIRESTISKMEIVQMEGKRKVKREQEFYNLDAIIAVGYRVNSKKATRSYGSCEMSCRGYCTGDCGQSCGGNCMGRCSNSCVGGCAGGCQGSCHGRCYGSCSGYSY